MAAKMMDFVHPTKGRTLIGESATAEQKFFASFFQKRRTCCL